MKTYIITEALDYVAVTLVQHKTSFIYDGCYITLAATEQFIKNLKSEDGYMAEITFYEQK